MLRLPLMVAGLFALGLASLALGASPAWADTVRLRSGTDLAVDEVRILERTVRMNVLNTGGIVTVELRFRDFDPVAFLASPHAAALTPLQRRRFELLACLVRRVEATEKARKAKAAAQAAKPAEPVPVPGPPPAPPRRADPTPPPREDPTGNVPPRGSYAEERYRNRVPGRPAPPVVPGRARPPIRDGGGGNALPTR